MGKKGIKIKDLCGVLGEALCEMLEVDVGGEVCRADVGEGVGKGVIFEGLEGIASCDGVVNKKRSKRRFFELSA